jgi:dipeptidyl aminopeptidase/acylaminoacyl peptidase
VPFSRAGEPVSRRALYIVDIPTKRPIRIDTGQDPEQSILALRWWPDGSEFVFMVMNREHKRLDLIAADAASGEARVILTETTETFLQPLWGSPPHFMLLADGERFIWTSDRDGWNHLYLYDLTGKPIRRLTEGPFPVHDVVTVDEEAGWVYFTAHADRKRPYDTHLYRVRLDGTGFAQLTEASGQHAIQFAPSKRFFLDTHSSVDRPTATELRQADGKLLQTLSRANIEALDALGWIPPEEFVVKAADGKTDLFGVLYKPYDFDPNGLYPVIEYIYDGLNTTVVPRTFSPSGAYSADDWFPLDHIDPKALAQLGFIVLVVDGLGTAERGRAFQDVAYGGRYNRIPDHVATLKQLSERRSYMDLSRVGIFGISAGGTNALRALLTAPDVYHVGVAIAAPVDPRNIRASGIEPFRGLLEKNPEAYESSMLALAESLAGKLLIVHGASDRVVSIVHTMKMVEALIDAGKPHDLLLLPGQDHLFRGTGATYARDATRRYFQEHLMPKR